MLKIWNLALILGLSIPALACATAPSPDAVMRLNHQAIEHIFQQEVVYLKEALKFIPIPDFSNGGFLRKDVPNIVGIHIDMTDILKLSVKFLPKFGIRLDIDTFLNLKGKCELADIQLKGKVQILTDVQISRDPSGCPIMRIALCNSEVGALQVTLGGNSLPPDVLNLLHGHIENILSSKLCLTLSNAIHGLNAQLGQFIALIKFGPQSHVKYLLTSSPVITADFIDFNVKLEFSRLGNVLNFPASRASFSLPAQISTASSMVNLALSGQLIKNMFTALQKSGTLNFEITGTEAGNNKQLTTGMLSTAAPEIMRKYPQSLPVSLRVVERKDILVKLKSGKVELELKPSIEIMVHHLGHEAESLLVLNSIIHLDVIFNIKDGTLLIASVALNGNISMTLDISAIGSIKVVELQKLISPVFTKTLLVHLNGVVSMGLHLPNLLNIQLVKPITVITQNYALVSAGIKLPL